jgi:hypothetical protein
VGSPARRPPERIERRRVTAASPGGYVPLRLDAPSLLGVPKGRREAHHLSASAPVNLGEAGSSTITVLRCRPPAAR